MAYSFANQVFNYWISLWDKMTAAQESTEVTLRDDLKTALENTRTSFKTLVDRYRTLRAQQRQARHDAASDQKKAQDLLNRVRYALISQVSKDQIAATLQVYDLDRRMPVKRENTLQRLRQVKETIVAQTSDDTKPNAALRTEIDTCYQQLEANISATQTLQADIEEVSRQLQTALVQNAELRERVLAFLISELPAGYQDPKLMDFGLRERFRSSSRVTAVATQAEPEPAPAPEPAQP